MSDELKALIDKLPVRTKPRVLVVDDNEDDFLLVKITLLHCDVFWAPSGEIGLKVLEDRADEFRVIILDEILPGGEPGCIILEKIKAKWQDKPVIMLTGSQLEEWRHQALLRAGALRVLRKPLSACKDEFDDALGMIL